ncbi:hypothetical protein LI177_13175 [bacterium 210820-DFI.6.37]|nr:hypothetical protein [bacterium 210820-DFI.6.37]
MNKYQSDSTVLLLDLDMERNSGIGLGREILNIQPETQIIFIFGENNAYPDIYEVDHIYS